MSTVTVIESSQANALNPYPQIFVRASQLVVSPYQVRKKTRTAEYLEGLAASIHANGLMFPLTAHEMPNKKGPKLYGVSSGGGRHLSIQMLLTRGLLDDARDLVPITVVPEEHAAALSLAENVHREDLHPADEFEGFKRMIDGGESIEDTAAAFGVDPLVVQRRMRLANAEPTLFELFREDEITLAQLMALCTTDNHELQKYVWENSRGHGRNPTSLRQSIIGERIDAGANPVAKFVGIDQYLAAGGAMERDLFSQGGASGFIADALLLNRLAAEKLEQQVETVRAEGWSWVETAITFTHHEKAEYRDAPEMQREVTKKEAKRLKEIEAELSPLSEKQYEEDLTDEEMARCEELEAEQNAIEAATYFHAPEVKAHAGAVVSIDNAGNLKIVRGLVRKEDVKALKRETEKVAVESGEKVAPAKATGLSERLYQRITAHQTLAMQAKLASAPNTALAVLLAEVIGGAFGSHSLAQFGLNVSLRPAHLDTHADNLDENPAHATLEQLRTAWLAKFPKKQKDLLPWLLKQSQDDLVALLALCSALSLNCVRNNDRRNTEREMLLDVLDVDMADYWKPSPANFLAHVNKTQILATVREAVSTAAVQAIQDMKKGPMIDGAFERLESTRWLPKFLRRKAAKTQASD